MEEDPQSALDQAVLDLVKVGIQAERKAYGFSVVLRDVSGEFQGHCGFEHDGSISLSVSPKTPLTVWFFCSSVQAMAQLLIAAQQDLAENPAQTWINALTKLGDASELE